MCSCGDLRELMDLGKGGGGRGKAEVRSRWLLMVIMVSWIIFE